MQLEKIGIFDLFPECIVNLFFEFEFCFADTLFWQKISKRVIKITLKRMNRSMNFINKIDFFFHIFSLFLFLF